MAPCLLKRESEAPEFRAHALGGANLSVSAGDKGTCGRHDGRARIAADDGSFVAKGGERACLVLCPHLITHTHARIFPLSMTTWSIYEEWLLLLESWMRGETKITKIIK